MKRLVCFTVACCLSAVAEAKARPLPDFTVQSASGGSLSSNDFCSQPRCAIAYVRVEERSQLGPSFVRRLAAQVPASKRSRLRLLIAGRPDEARALADQLTELLPGVVWALDPSDSAGAALGLTTPAGLVIIERTQIVAFYPSAPHHLEFLSGL